MYVISINPRYKKKKKNKYFVWMQWIYLLKFCCCYVYTISSHLTFAAQQQQCIIVVVHFIRNLMHFPFSLFTVLYSSCNSRQCALYACMSVCCVYVLLVTFKVKKKKANVQLFFSFSLNL